MSASIEAGCLLPPPFLFDRTPLSSLSLPPLPPPCLFFLDCFLSFPTFAFFFLSSLFKACCFFRFLLSCLNSSLPVAASSVAMASCSSSLTGNRESEVELLVGISPNILLVLWWPSSSSSSSFIPPLFEEEEAELFDESFFCFLEGRDAFFLRHSGHE